MPPKKNKAKKPKASVSQKQIAQQKQNINIRIGDLSTKRKSRKKRAPRAPRVAEDTRPMVQLPPVVYQIPAMNTSYDFPARTTIADPVAPRTTIADPVAPRTPIVPILEDVGLVGKSEIVDRPDKSEVLSSLIEPVAPAFVGPVLPPEPVAPARLSPPRTIDPAELAPYKDTQKGLREFKFPSGYDSSSESDYGPPVIDFEDILVKEPRASATAMPKKRGGGRPKGRPNRSAEEIRQMAMDDLERKRLRQQAKDIKNSAKELRRRKKLGLPDSGEGRGVIIRKKMTKKLEAIKDELSALNEGDLRSSES